jgi:hypothetical protein
MSLAVFGGGLTAGAVGVLWATAPAPSVQFEPPDFGTFVPGERRAVEVRLVNPGWRSIRLAEPTVNCGCVVVAHRGPVTVPARGETTVALKLTAPGRPSITERTLTLQREDNPEATWSVPLRIVVDADMWAESGPAVLEYDLPYLPDQLEAVPVTVRHKPHVRLDRVESSDPQVVVESVCKSDGEMRLTCRPTAPDRPIGEAALRVFAVGGTAPVLEVPIRWRPRSQVRFVPATLMLDGFAALGPRFERRVDLFFRGEVAEFDVKPLVPWATVRSERTSASGATIWVGFDGPAMPANFDQPLVQVSIPGDPSAYKVHGVGSR